MRQVEEVYIPETSRASMSGDNTQTSKKADDSKTPQQSAVDLVKRYKEGVEANVVGSLFQNADLFLDCRLTEKDFSYPSWKTFFIILHHLYRENKTFTEDNIDFFLMKKPELRNLYDYYQGYKTLSKLDHTMIHVEDFGGYLAELIKWNAVLNLAEIGFNIEDKISSFVDLSAEDIYCEYSGKLNHAFINLDENVKTYNAFDGIQEMNDACDTGVEQGYQLGKYGSLNSFPVLNSVINGFSTRGQIYGLGAVSGMGKSTMIINYLFPLILENNEPALFIINEEDQNKFKREAETWIINNIILRNIPDKKFDKKRFVEGHFTEEEKGWLKQAAEFMEQRKDENLILIVPLERYSAELAIKLIKKYAQMFNIKIFVLDTFKEGYDIGKTETWKAMERDMRALYDTVKESALNVGLFVTYQLGKQSIKTSYLTNAEVGQARNIIDVMSVNIMIRRPFNEEGLGQRKELKYYTKVNSDPNDHSTYIYQQKKDTNYMITFVTKNRRGDTDPYQILSECDFSTNVIRDVGYCFVKEDF